MMLKHTFLSILFSCTLFFFELLAPTNGYAQYSFEELIVAPQPEQAIEQDTDESAYNTANALEAPSAKTFIKTNCNNRVPYGNTAVRDQLPRPIKNSIARRSTAADNLANTKPHTEEPLHVHHFKETLVEATCSHEGYTLHMCVCGESYRSNMQEKVSHNFTAEEVPPTAESAGYTLHYCINCGDQYKDNYVDPISETDDTDESEDQDGYRTGETCGQGTPETEDYGYCPDCGIRIWTTWYTIGCFTFLEDTVCDCGILVHAGECHHH